MPIARIPTVIACARIPIVTRIRIVMPIARIPLAAFC